MTVFGFSIRDFRVDCSSLISIFPYSTEYILHLKAIIMIDKKLYLKKDSAPLSEPGRGISIRCLTVPSGIVIKWQFLWDQDRDLRHLPSSRASMDNRLRMHGFRRFHRSPGAFQKYSKHRCICISFPCTLPGFLCWMHRTVPASFFSEWRHHLDVKWSRRIFWFSEMSSGSPVNTSDIVW